MSDKKLGQLINGSAERDAIHIAIAPVTAACVLFPGQHVGLVNGVAAPCEKPIGIVDPFLQSSVQMGERFYLCLYQQTVTGMRHHWSHPSFQEAENDTEKAKMEAEAKIRKWLEQYQEDYLKEEYGRNNTFESLVAEWNSGGGFTFVGFDTPDQSETEPIKTALAIYTGKMREDFYFSCSC